MDNCRFCRGDKLVRAGFVHKVQRYICKLCKRSQLENVNRDRCDFYKKLKAIQLSQSGMSLRSISQALEVSSTSVFRWLKNSKEILNQALELALSNNSLIQILDNDSHFNLIINIPKE